MDLYKKVFTVKLLISSVILLYIAVVTLDIILGQQVASYTVFIKYLSILICVGVVFLIREDGEDRKDTMFLEWALVLTAVGDLFLVILERPFLGVLSFSAVQILHLIRYGRKSKLNKGFTLVALIFYIGLFYALYWLETLGDNYLVLSAGLTYAAILLTSVYVSIYTELYEKRIKYAIVSGMILFLLCDICVGISYMLQSYNIFPMQQNVLEASSLLIWIFYVPSQLLLALSGYKYEFIEMVFSKKLKTS